MQKVDRRFKRSENQFVNALVALLNKKELSDISINSLTKQADLNKSTFYLHYSSIEQVLNSLQDSLISDAYTLYQESNGDLNSFIGSLLDKVKKQKKVYRTVLSQSNSSLIDSLYLTFFGLFKASNNKKMDRSVYLRFSMLSCLISALRLWSQDLCASPKEELCSYMVELIMSNV